MLHSTRSAFAVLCAVTLCAVATPTANAQSTARFGSAHGYSVASAAETASSFHLEAYDSAGTAIRSVDCSAALRCTRHVAGGTKTIVYFNPDATRETVTSATCNGVESISPPQLSCVDGDLTVRVTIREGLINIKLQGDSLLDTGSSAGPTRIQFAGDATRYRPSPNGFKYDSASRAYWFPIGSYQVHSPDLQHHCKPRQTNPGVRVDVQENAPPATVTVLYHATECTVQVTSDIDVGGLTMTSDRGPLTCEAKGQRGSPSTKSVCTGVFPFDQPVTISATVPAGLEPYFEWVNNTCERLPLDRTKCSFKPKFDSDLAIFVNIRMTTNAVGAPPPPPPVALSVAAADSVPIDRAAAKGAIGEPMLVLRATAASGTARMTALTLTAAGTGRDDLDLIDVRVVVDGNRNGVADAGDAVVAHGRPVADNGTFRLDFTSPMDVSGTVDLVVVADIASTVNSASAAAWGVAGVVLAFGCLAWPANRRRAVPTLLVLAMVLAVASGCGGGGDEGPSDPVVVDPPPVAPSPPVLVNYRLDVTAVHAVDAAVPATVVNVPSLPIVGVTLTVAR